MKVKCGDCGKLLELQDVKPAMDQDGVFWFRIWCVIIPAVAMVAMSGIGYGVYSTHLAHREAEALLKEPTIKVRVTEFPDGRQMREFNR